MRISSEEILKKIVVERMQFMIKYISALREKKIMNFVLNQEKVDSALLTNNEKLFTS